MPTCVRWGRVPEASPVPSSMLGPQTCLLWRKTHASSPDWRWAERPDPGWLNEVTRHKRLKRPHLQEPAPSLCSCGRLQSDWWVLLFFLKWLLPVYFFHLHSCCLRQHRAGWGSSTVTYSPTDWIEDSQQISLSHGREVRGWAYVSCYGNQTEGNTCD